MGFTLVRKLVVLVFLTALVYQGAAQNKLKVGIISFKSDEKVLETFVPIMDKLAAEMGRKAEVKLVDSEDLAFYLDKGSFDLGIFTVFPYLKEKQDFPNLEVFATHQIKGQDFFYGSIMTNKNSAIDAIQDLKKKKVLFVKPTSTSGFKYPKGILTEFDLDIEKSLSYEFSGGHIESIEALQNRSCDAIAIDETRFAKLDSLNKGDFKELVRYKVPYHAYAMSPKLSLEKKEEIKEVFKNAHKNPALRALWKNPLGVEKFILKNDDYYNPIRRYLRIIRVKPTVEVVVEATAKAKEKLESKGDIIASISKRIKRRITESKRFSNQQTETPDYKLKVELAYTGNQFGYQVIINDHLITDGDVLKDSLGTSLPHICSEALLREGKIQTNLLTNGEKWFITYGYKDGLNKEDYTFEILNEAQEKVVLNGNDILDMNEMNIQFKHHPAFIPNQEITINYIKEAHEIPVVAKHRTYNIFTAEFWRQSMFNKLLAFIGPLVALILAFTSGMFSRRKKKNFKTILYDTNDLLKKFVEGNIEMETKLIQQKENIRVSLEKGIINENQYIILNQRLEELEFLIDNKQVGDAQISEEDAAEIAEMLSDGVVTEKEFTRIMRILNKRRSV